MKTKELKHQLWQAYYTAKDEGASREVTNAILDVMVIADKEAEEKKMEKTKVSSCQTPIIIVYLGHNKATFNWGNRQHPNTRRHNPMNI